MSEVRVNNLSNENNTGGPTISGITTYSGRHFFVPPQGTTEERPSDCEPGSLRFNTDTAHLEYFRGNTIGWVEIEAELTLPLGGGGSTSQFESNRSSLGHRAIFAAGSDASSNALNPIDFITIPSLGNATDFGDMGNATNRPGGLANNIRGLISGGSNPSYTDNIEFITVSSQGDNTGFGNLTQSRWYPACLSSQTRGIMGGGYGPANFNIIDFVTIASTGDAVDFGDLTATKREVSAVCSTTRGIFCGGQPVPATNVIEFITISTTGDAADFGDLTGNRLTAGAGTSATRGVLFGGGSPGAVNIIDFITMASTGNAIDFGDTLEAKSLRSNGITSDCVRALTAGYSGGNVIEFVQIATTGNSKDFGDLTVARFVPAAMSTGHGGL